MLVQFWLHRAGDGRWRTGGVYGVRRRDVQERRGLGGVRGVPGAHVVERCRLQHRPDVYGVSPQRHVVCGEPGARVLLLRGGVRAGQRHGVVCAVQSG